MDLFGRLDHAQAQSPHPLFRGVGYRLDLAAECQAFLRQPQPVLFAPQFRSFLAADRAESGRRRDEIAAYAGNGALPNRRKSAPQALNGDATKREIIALPGRVLVERGRIGHAVASELQDSRRNRVRRCRP